MTEEKYTLITGASHGMGKCLAIEFARKKRNLILVSLPDEGLSNFTIELKKQFNVNVVGYETNLCNRQDVLSFATWVNSNFSIDVLINNAGMGGSRKFTDVTTDFILKILDLNVVATTLLTHQLLPNLLKQKQAYLLNISSLAALAPIGYKTVYPASKAFITSFTKGLAYELKDTHVFVCVAHPGPMKTTVENTIRLEKQGRLGKFVQATPEQNAKKIVEKLFLKKRVIVLNPLNYYVMRLFPRWLKTRMVSNASRKEILEQGSEKGGKAKKDVEWSA